MTVKVFKMINGEEIIGEVFDVFSDTIELKEAAQIVLQRTDGGGMGVALAPVMPYAEGNLKFHKQSIMIEGEPSQSLVNEYNRVFGSGIQVAPASALAGLQIAK